jgi:predicted AlkP superfamily pyrophosphatase or phosphodiesterase
MVRQPGTRDAGQAARNRLSGCLVVAALLMASAAGCAPTGSPAPRRHLLIVVDGLRPDYVTAEVMPKLTALGKRGVVFSRHHAVYPTVTRVNASSMSTGAYPETHGLLGNTVFFPKVDPARFLDTADRNSLLKIGASEGRLLTAPTLGESLQAAGRKMLVVSSGSSGSAFLNNHQVAGGAILHYQYVLPAALEQEMKSLGPPPTEEAPVGALDRYAVDAFLKVGIPRVDPSVTVMWLSDLDSTAHSKGVGAPDTTTVLRQVDSEIGRIEEGLKTAGLFDSYDIWVTSDHGFSTHTGAIDLNALLKPFARSLDDGSPRLVTNGNAIYVRDGDPVAISGITAALQKTPGVGAVFTRESLADSDEGSVAGTLSFHSVHWDHERSAQIMFSPDWSDQPNAYAMRGTVAAGGVAGHGSSSPWDVHNTLIAAGPDLIPGRTFDTPSANVDFTPTFLRLLGLPIPPSVQGRPLEEALVHGSGPEAAVQRTEHTVTSGDGSYAVTANFSTVNAGGTAYRYFDGTSVKRRP